MKSRKVYRASSTQKKKLTRGLTIMKSVVHARRKGIKFEVGWNTKGQPINPNAPKLVSYIGATVRQMVLITCDNWKDSALDVFKNNIWADIQTSFVVGESRRKYVLQKAGSLHRSFRTFLTKHYLRDANGNVNDHPPKKYAHIISEDVWRAFVAKRTEDNSFQKLSKENRQRAASNQFYPYRKSRKGYAGIEQDLLLQETGLGLTAIQRHILWKNARVNKAGVIDNENVQQVWDKCVYHETLSQPLPEGEIQDDGRQDILARVLNVPERPGHVRAVGFGVSQRDYFPLQKRPKHASVSEMQSLRETLEQLMCKAEYLENKLQQKEVVRQPDLASPSAEDSCTRASCNPSEDYPDIAKLTEKGLRNSSDIDIHFKDTVAIATSCCAWAPSEDPEKDGGSDTNRTDTPITEERDVQDVGVQGKEYVGVEDLATYQSPSSERPKRKRTGRGDKRGSVGHQMCVQGKEFEVGDTNRTDMPITDEHYVQDVGVQGNKYEGVKDLAIYPGPSSERPKRKRVGKGSKGGSVGRTMCVQEKEHEGAEDLATYPGPPSERPKRKRAGKGAKGGNIGRTMCVQEKEHEGAEDLATFPGPPSERPKRKRAGKGAKGGNIGRTMCVQEKEHEGAEDLATYPSPPSERPKRKRAGKGAKGGSIGRTMCVQEKEHEGAEDLATYPGPSSERPKRKRVGKGAKGGSVGRTMCVREKEHEGDEELATYPSPSSERPKRKGVGKGDKGGSVGHRMCEQSDRIIESLNNENNVTVGNITNAPPSLADCLDMLKQLPEMKYGGETHIIGIRLMKSESNREIFALLNDPILQLNWIKSHTLADVSRL